MKTLMMACAAIALTACGESIPSPIVDMQGVDPVKYNQDLADCHTIASKTAFAFGNPVTDCMKALSSDGGRASDLFEQIVLSAPFQYRYATK